MSTTTTEPHTISPGDSVDAYTGRFDSRGAHIGGKTHYVSAIVGAIGPRTKVFTACGRRITAGSAYGPKAWTRMRDDDRCKRCVRALPAEVEPSPDATATILADVLARPGVSVMTEASAESFMSDALDVTAYAETPTGSVPLVTVTTEGRKVYLMRRHRFDEHATRVHTFDLVTRLASAAVAADLAHTLAAVELAAAEAAA
ncbi:hypothetical protein ACFCZ3_20170 [Cellulosimicrobium cellulans]|uniref:hypothetical protein n=1 Tax=Cellulosimicrobium cellulans TaxID=1710 RepID=UPI0035E38CAA